MSTSAPGHLAGHDTRMVDDFEGQEVRSSGELWTEICSSLPDVQAEAAPENNPEFKDSFQPAAQVGVQVNGQSNGTNTGSSSAEWEPMEDSEIYIPSLGADTLPVSLCPFPDCRPHVTFSSDYSIHHTPLSFRLQGSLLG